MKIQKHTDDAIGGNRVENLESAPFLVKGFGANVLKSTLNHTAIATSSRVMLW